MLRILAHFFSFLFHPLLMLTYILVILIMFNPYMFGQADVGQLTVLVFLTTFFIPAFSVAMMKMLGLI